MLRGLARRLYQCCERDQDAPYSYDPNSRLVKIVHT